MTDPPPPLTRDTYAQTRQEVHAHDHALFTYDDETQLAVAAAAFLAEGMAREELCVFVHSFPDDAQARAFLERAVKDPANARDDRIVLVSIYKEAFEGARPHIDYDHVQAVVSSLDARAQEASRAGVRIFVDASRRYFAEAREQEWLTFESWLGRRLQASVGLVCAYRREDVMRPDIFPQVLRTHAYRFDVTQGSA